MADNPVSGPPIWLMDVDGVLNSFGHVDLPGPELRTFKSGNGYEITYDTTILERLAALHQEGRVEIRWLTTWGEEADAHLAEEFGLPRGLKVEATMPFRERYGWWKLEAVKAAHERGDRIVWTDDDINFEPAANAWLSDTDPNQIIWLSPSTHLGITHEFIDRVEEWLGA